MVVNRAPSARFFLIAPRGASGGSICNEKEAVAGGLAGVVSGVRGGYCDIKRVEKGLQDDTVPDCGRELGFVGQRLGHVAQPEQPLASGLWSDRAGRSHAGVGVYGKPDLDQRACFACGGICVALAGCLLPALAGAELFARIAVRCGACRFA